MQPYKKLFTYWYSLVIYDLTVEFCQKFLVRSLRNLRSLQSPEGLPAHRTIDQMIQAARSGKQNIVEGSAAMNTSLKTAIKLTNVAKASLEELLADFEDFLRQRGLPQWSKSDPRVRHFRARSARLVRNLSNLRHLREPAALVQKALPLPARAEEAANLLLTLCHQATYLLDKQVKSLERKHQTEGGYTENLYRRRLTFRG